MNASGVHTIPRSQGFICTYIFAYIQLCLQLHRAELNAPGTQVLASLSTFSNSETLCFVHFGPEFSGAYEFVIFIFFSDVVATLPC